MAIEPAVSDVQPRSVRELFVRAVQLAVRNAGPLGLTLAIAALPVAVYEIVFASESARVWSLLAALAGAVAAGRSAEVTNVQAQLAALHGGNVVAGLILLSAVLWPLARTAFVRAAAAADAGEPIAVGGVLTAALRRWPAQLGVGVITIAAAIPLALAWFAAVLLTALAAGLVAYALHATPGALGVLGVAGGCAGLAVYALGQLAFDVATIAVALETTSPLRACTLAVRRVFDRGLRRRSFAVAGAMLALSFAGAVAAVVLGGMTVAALHVEAAGTLVATATTLAVELVRLGFAVEFSADARVRREGYDLVLAADALDMREPVETTDGLLPAERALIERYVRRRARLTDAARRQLAGDLAARVRPHLRASFDHLDDDALLEHLGRNA